MAWLLLYNALDLKSLLGKENSLENQKCKDDFINRKKLLYQLNSVNYIILAPPPKPKENKKLRPRDGNGLVEGWEDPPKLE